MISPVITDDTLSIHFDDFSLPAYDVFLRAKTLPEWSIEFHEDTETYTITAPARFAALLGIEPPKPIGARLPPPPFLYDDQTIVLEMALAAKRFAAWCGCGWGKTLLEIEFARQVNAITGKRVLVITLNEIVGQWLEMVTEFYADTLPVVRLESRQQMRDWAAGRIDGPAIGITNYEKMNHKTPEDQIVNELRHLGGVILDESDRLKGGGGKQKWALIKSCRGIEFKLSCTATPAPNDTIEFASQASFLEKMRTEGDIIWTFFSRDEKTQKWTVKPHAREAFFRFMSTWSIYINNPKAYGWRLDHPDVPEPEYIVHHIEPTLEQIQEQQRLTANRKTGERKLYTDEGGSAVQRLHLSQIAKGFRYLKGQQGKYRRIPSEKPWVVASLIGEEIDAGYQVLVWTVFDAETELLVEGLRECRGPMESVAVLRGGTPDAERVRILEEFRHGRIQCLISSAQMLGYGLNFQFVRSMIFSGWNDSFVQWYQAIRRAYRDGQKYALRVHIPCIELLEGDMLDNIGRKGELHRESIAEMERNYIAVLKGAEHAQGI